MKTIRLSRRALRSLPIAALSILSDGDACAQVTLSGRVDLTVVKSVPGIWQEMPGGSSRLIFRAVDDLGGGSSAYGYLQHRFNADDGTAKTPFWYSSYVGLRNDSYGDLRVGYQVSPIDDATGSHYEVWDGDTLASRYSSIAGGTKLITNQVRYTTPQVFGFRVGGGMMPSEGAAGTVRGQGGTLFYDQGGLSAAVSVQRNPNNVLDHAIGGRYVAEKWRVLGSWAEGTRVSGKFKQIDLQLSAGYKPTPQGEIRVLYNPSKLANVKTTLQSVGYFYWLSKRTALLADVAQKKVSLQPSVVSYQAGIRVDF